MHPSWLYGNLCCAPNFLHQHLLSGFAAVHFFVDIKDQNSKSRKRGGERWSSFVRVW